MLWKLLHNTAINENLSSGCNNPANIVWSTSYGCPGPKCGRFSARNIFTLEDDRRSDIRSNYWLAENGKAGKNQGFVLGLGCRKMVSGVWLKNVRNPPGFDRGTKMFRLLGSSTFSDGPWKRLIGNLLEDSRKTPPKVKTLMFDKPLVLRYIKFELVEYWGLGGGLQYFEPILTNTTVKDSGTTTRRNYNTLS